jgi:hypothetical protein
VGYEDNVNLEEDDPVDSARYEVDLFARAGWLSERTQVLGRLRAFTRRYPGNERLDSDNLSAALDLGFRASELDRLRLNLRFDRDTSQQSELTTTGNIAGNVPRNAFTVRPEWERQLTARSALGLAYAFTSVSFEENTSGLVDYAQSDVDLRYQHQWTERLGVRGTLSLVAYEPDTDDSYRGYDGTLGLTYAISETLIGDLFLGPQWITSEPTGGGSEQTESGVLYGFSLAKRFDRGDASLSVNRGAVPTGSAEPLLRESLTLDFNYQLSPRVSVSLPLDLYRSEQVDFGGSNQDAETRLFWSTQPALNWRLTEDLVLRTSYRYQYQSFDEGGGSADGNAVFLSLSYVWPAEIPGSPP